MPSNNNGNLDYRLFDERNSGLQDAPHVEKKGSLVKKIIIGLVLCGVLAVVLYFIIHRNGDGDGGGGGGEGGSVPPATQSRILAYGDFTKDPCNEFYEFACGRWLENTVLPPGASKDVPSFNIIANETRFEQLEILSRNFPYIGDFYYGCRNTTDIERTGDEYLKTYLDFIDTITDLDSFARVLGTMTRLGISDAIFHPVLGDHPSYRHMPVWDNLRIYLMLDQPLVSFDHSDKSKYYRLLDALGVGGNITEQGDAVFAFENALVNIYNAGTGQHSFVTRNEFFNATGFPLTSWMDGYGDASIVGQQSGAADHIDDVLVWDMDLYGQVMDLPGLLNFDATMVKNYLKIHLVVSALSVIPARYTQAWEGTTDLLGARKLPNFVVSHVMDYVKQMFPLEHQQKTEELLKDMNIYEDVVGEMSHTVDNCLSLTLGLFGDYFSHKWVDADFPPENKVLATQLVEKISAQLKVRIDEVEWLDEATRVRAQAKLKLVAHNVGYDLPWDTYPDLVINGHLVHDLGAITAENTGRTLKTVNSYIDRYKFPPLVGTGFTLMTLNAFYQPSYNNINMLAGLMQDPFFSKDHPLLLNLAAYGFVIGHEISHGFDNSGRLYNGTGAEDNWWTDIAAQHFDEQTACLIKQYNGFPYYNMTVNGNQTLGENIADLGGLGNAWKIHSQTTYDKQYMEEFTNDQLFWIYAAQGWCQKDTYQAAHRQIHQDVHSPGKFRVLGPMSNLKGFAETFHCTADDYMGRSLTDKQCVVW